jgi:hypothetical protein
VGVVAAARVDFLVEVFFAAFLDGAVFFWFFAIVGMFSL